MKKLFGLGKGLGSLIPTSTERKNDSKKENVFYVEVNKIKPNPDQPRRDFDQEGIKELSKSVRKYGVLQPLLVSKVESETPKGLDVTYQLIAGERRLQASKLARLPHVPVIIRDDFEQKGEKLEVALVENVQRKDLNAIEEAEAYQRLTKEFGLTQNEIASRVSKSRVNITNTIRLLNLPNDIKSAVRSGKLQKAHAKALLSFSDSKKQREIYNQILAGGLTTKEVETMASSTKPPSKVGPQKDIKFVELEKNLSQTLEAPVLIRNSAAGGRITIKFASLEDLNKIAKNIID